MIACKIVLAILLAFTTYGAWDVTPGAWTTPDLKIAISLSWLSLFTFWALYVRILRFDPNSK